MTEKYCNIEQNLLRVKERIAQSARSVGRNEGDVTLLGVTKTMPAEVVAKAVGYGLSSIGENYTAEIVQKAPLLTGADIHMIGHLQSNKIKDILPHISMLQSLDSVRLAKKLQAQLQASGAKLQVLLQVNIGEEHSKSGIPPHLLDEVICEVDTCENLIIKGLMCIPPAGDERQTRKYFSKMFNLYIDIKGKKLHNIDNINVLSMGMSNDYEAAITEGATLVRVGSAIFGER